MSWTNIPNANLEAGAPVRSVDTLAIRDNIIAVPNGDSGAPRINGVAIKKIDDFPVLDVTSTENINLADTDSGLNISAVYGDTLTYSTSYVVAYTFTIEKVQGSITVKASQRTGSDYTTTSYMRFKKNGVVFSPVWTWQLSSNISRSQTVSVAVGDVITIEHYSLYGPDSYSYVTSSSLWASNGYIYRSPILENVNSAL